MTIEEYYESEKLKMSWLARFLRNFPVINTTKDLASKENNLFIDEDVIIKPSIRKKILALFFLIIPIFMWFTLINMLFEGKLIPIALLFLLFVSIFIWQIIRVTFWDKKYVYTLKISNNGLQIDNQLLNWNDITGTLIQEKVGKKTEYILIILAKDEKIYRKSLFNFTVSEKRLSEIIEFYSAQTTAREL